MVKLGTVAIRQSSSQPTAGHELGPLMVCAGVVCSRPQVLSNQRTGCRHVFVILKPPASRVKSCRSEISCGATRTNKCWGGVSWRPIGYECVVISSILKVRLNVSVCVDEPAGITQEEDHTGVLPLLLFFPVLASVLYGETVQSSRILLDRLEMLILCANKVSLVHTCFGHAVRNKIPVRTTAPRLEPTCQRQKVERLPNEPLGRPVRGSCDTFIADKAVVE